MALESGFFNSVNKDRQYNAEQISRYFENILSSGIFKRIENCLKVSASSGMSLTVAPGAGLIDCHWFRARSAETVTIPTAHAVLPRFDIVAARLDMSENARAISLSVISGTPAETPEAPAPVRTSTVYDLVLALVYVPAGATSIVADNLTDVRDNDYYCGYVQNLVGTPIVKTYQYRYTAPANDTTVAPIGVSGFNAGSDVLNVYVNGFRLAPGKEYTVNTSTNSITLVEAIDAGTLVDFEIYRPAMPDDVPDVTDAIADITQDVADFQSALSTEQAARIAAFNQVAPIGPGVFAFDGQQTVNGFISASSSRMYFTLPFNRVIDATGFTVKFLNVQARQGGGYILGGASTWQNIASSVVSTSIAKNGALMITCAPTFNSTPANNAECAIQIEATAEIEFT